ncbi:phosphatidylinositol-3-phosphate/phosphatidylinos itol 5-kinase, partial [Thecamonas trahens ATCC 50062]
MGSATTGGDSCHGLAFGVTVDGLPGWGFSVLSLFEPEFAALRGRAGIDESLFRASLARCMQWQAQGGKSSASFCKTLDERFVLKSMSRVELEHFVRIGTEYFARMARGAPSCLARIFGVYRVALRTCEARPKAHVEAWVEPVADALGPSLDVLADSLAQSGMPEGAPVASDEFLVVMENVLFGALGEFDAVYDLKGSQRSREACTGATVRMDGNFGRERAVAPLFMPPGPRSELLEAARADTDWLVEHNIMDYSMLLAVSEATGSLHVGIIDWLRPYTWDKKVESQLKTRLEGLRRAKARVPTVIPPPDYARRFLAAIESYLPALPP